MNWTPKQQEVIEARNKTNDKEFFRETVKTMPLLIEWANEEIRDDKNILIDRLLIVTFMRNAASDMKEKIRKRLRKALEEDPDNANLKRQLSLVYAADISTIDSFARKIVSDNFENPAIDIDPNFRNMDEAEENMLFEDTLQEVLEQRYEDYDEDFQKLLDMLSKGKIDDNIKYADNNARLQYLHSICAHQKHIHTVQQESKNAYVNEGLDVIINPQEKL